MKILYLSGSYVPSRRASSAHVMKMCSAFSRVNHDVVLITKRAPTKQESDVDDEFSYYGVLPEFELRRLPRPAWRSGGLVYLFHMQRFFSKLQPAPDLVYSRDIGGAVLATRRNLPLVFEAHGPPLGFLSRRLHQQVLSSSSLLRLVVISEALKSLFEESGLLGRDLDVIVAHDAADPLTTTPRVEHALAPSLDVPGVTHVGYVGHLYPGRGIQLIVELARQLPSHQFHLVGGAQLDIDRWRARAIGPNLHFHGFVPPSRLPAFYRAFDVLIAPYQSRVMVASGKTDTSVWMSPMKLFEYMAAGKPIVASNLPVLREVLRHGQNCLLVQPDDLPGWKQVLKRLSSDPSTASALGETALRDFLLRHTWDGRAAQVLAGL